MKAKLSKEGSFGYKIKFYNDDDMAACALGLLSLKNCQAIENGYDLDKLADEMLEKAQTPHKLMSPITYRDGVIKGFQKALELMGDKKFSEEDIKQTLYLKTGFDKNGFSFYKSDEEIIQSLQQTEWEVEVEMDILNEYDKPKLDTDGCLILKRV